MASRVPHKTPSPKGTYHLYLYLISTGATHNLHLNQGWLFFGPFYSYDCLSQMNLFWLGWVRLGWQITPLDCLFPGRPISKGVELDFFMKLVTLVVLNLNKTQKET